jgi:hypothetical protein
MKKSMFGILLSATMALFSCGKADSTDGKVVITGNLQNAPDGVQITDDIWEEQTPGLYNKYWLKYYEGYIPYESLLTKKK